MLDEVERWLTINDVFAYVIKMNNIPNLLRSKLNASKVTVSCIRWRPTTYKFRMGHVGRMSLSYIMTNCLQWFMKRCRLHVAPLPDLLVGRKAGDQRKARSCCLLSVGATWKATTTALTSNTRDKEPTVEPQARHVIIKWDSRGMMVEATSHRKKVSFLRF